MKFKALLPYAGLMLLALVVGVLASYLTFGTRPPERPHTVALMLHAPKLLPDFSLTDTSGAGFTRSQLMGHWSLLYFGYTHCPDACPTTLAALDKLSRMFPKLPPAKRPHVYFISVDPKRDDLQLLKNYALYFNADFTGVTGSVENLRALTTPLGADFSYEKPDKQGNYGVIHSTAVILVDPEAEETAIYTPPLDVKHMAADYVNIIRYYGEQW